LGEISNKINEMIQAMLESAEWTSANPTHINTFIQANTVDNPNFENDIKKIVGTTKEGKTVAKWDKGNIGEISRFTTAQTGNLVRFVSNPLQFMLGAFVRSRGGGVIVLAIAIFAAVKLIINELLKPGRLLDVRFKRDINKEIIAFRRREDQQKIKQGFSNIIISSMPRLRPTNGNQITNTLNMAAGRQSFPDMIGANPMMIVSSGVSISKSKGGRFPGGNR